MPPYCYRCNAPCEDGKCKCPPKVRLTQVNRWAWKCPGCEFDNETDKASDGDDSTVECFACLRRYPYTGSPI